MSDQSTHHYPPELMALLINTIPRLIRGKRDVLVFFKGCGVASALYEDLERTVSTDRKSITKYEIVRRVLERLNDRGEAALRQRREIVKRVAHWDDFTSCYDNDRMEAKGYVAEVRKLVDVKDAFTRMNLEREKAESDRRAKREAEIAAEQLRRAEREGIKADLFALFTESDANKRGLALEGVLNRLFASHGILIREAFRRVGRAGEGVVEQIDGVVEQDGHVYLVEMKWHTSPLGPPEVSQHLVRVFNRGAARGLLISHSGYTKPAVTICRESLSRTVFILAKLEELVHLLECDESLGQLLQEKARVAIVDKEPLWNPRQGVLGC